MSKEQALNSELLQRVSRLEAALAELASRAAWAGSGVIDPDGHSNDGLQALTGLMRDTRQGRLEQAISVPEEKR